MIAAPFLVPAGDIVGDRWQVRQLIRKTATSSLYLAAPCRAEDPMVVLRFPAGRAPWDAVEGPFFAAGGLLTDAAQRIQLQHHEAAVLGRLSHPNVVQIADFGEHRGYPFVALVHFAGVPMPRFEWHPRQRLAEIVAVFATVSETLAYVHECGVVHRDVKPANVLVQRRGDGSIDVRLADFALALADGAGPPGRVGTSVYKAPERIAAERSHGPGPVGAVDGRSDLYAVGVGLYETLARMPPFPAGSAVERGHFLAVPPPIAGIPPALAAVVETLLAKDPEARYADGEVAAAALRATLVTQDRAGAQPAVHLPAPNPWAQRLAWAQQQRAAAPDNAAAHLGLARIARQVGALDIAGQAADSALQLTPNSHSSGLERVRCYLAARRLDDAVAAIEQLVNAHGVRPVYAELAWAAGDVEGAQRLAWALLEQDPNAGLRLWRTLAQSALGALDRAAAAPLLWRALARACAVLGRSEQARAAADRAGALAPLDPVTKASLELLDSDPTAAHKQIREALAVVASTPTTALEYLARAEAWCDTGDTARATSMLAGLAATQPADVTSWCALARVCLRLGMDRPALDAATRACDIVTFQNSAAWGYRALAHLRLKQSAEAAAALERDADSTAGRGARLLLATEVDSEVPVALAEAVAAEPVWDPDVAVAAGLVFLSANHNQRALEMAERAVILASDRAESWLCLALAAERADALGLAVDAAERALARNEQQQAAHDCLARCAHRLGIHPTAAAAAVATKPPQD